MNELKQALINGTVVVEFVKKNGDLRVMKCTTNFGVITINFPEFVKPTNERVKPEGLFVVWDLEKNAWRSFNYHQVKKYEKAVA